MQTVAICGLASVSDCHQSQLLEWRPMERALMLQDIFLKNKWIQDLPNIGLSEWSENCFVFIDFQWTVFRTSWFSYFRLSFKYESKDENIGRACDQGVHGQALLMNELLHLCEGLRDTWQNCIIACTELNLKHNYFRGNVLLCILSQNPFCLVTIHATAPLAVH